MSKIKEHFSKEADQYDQWILQIVPYYSTIVEILVDVVGAQRTDAPRFLDLGSGTGMVTAQLKEKFPESSIVCVDIAQNMLDLAQKRLQAYNDIDYIAGDFCQVDFGRGFDAVVSSLAMHHIEEGVQKKELFGRINRALKPAGCFYNADIVLGASGHIQEMNIEKWKEYMRRSVSEEEIENKWLRRHRETDRPCLLVDELEWLKQAGFASVDVIWKYYNMVIYGGLKK